MFWRSKKSKPKPAASPPAPPGGSGPPGSGAPVAEEPSTQFLTGDSDVDRRTVEVLLDSIARVSEARDIEELLVLIVDRSVEVTGAERGFLIILGPDGEAAIRVARGRDGKDVRDDLRFSTSIVKGVVDSQKPKLATVQSDADALELSRSVFDLKIRAVMCVPVVAPTSDGGRVRGALYVDSRVATREFDHRDLGLFAALSAQISIALENARLHQHSVEKVLLERNLDLASAIQRGLMQKVPKDVPGIELHAWYGAAESTSGDFFDFVEKKKTGELIAVIGDVTGHGIGPALVTASAQASLRSYLKVLPDLGSAVTELDQDLSDRTDDGMFLTLLVIALQESGEMQVVNAGHHGPIIWRRGEFLPCEAHGVALGMLPEVPHTVDAVVQLESGDVVVGFTDGLIEAHSPDDRDALFGEERVRKLVGELAAAGKSAEDITRLLAEAALSFAGGVHEDDITLVVIRKL